MPKIRLNPCLDSVGEKIVSDIRSALDHVLLKLKSNECTPIHDRTLQQFTTRRDGQWR